LQNFLNTSHIWYQQSEILQQNHFLDYELKPIFTLSIQLMATVSWDQ